jgi:PadR family transcriptional regulator PadR
MDLRGHLDLLILATLRHTGPVHGYALIGALRERSDGTFDLPEGTVYPALHRLESSGLISSEWSADTQRRRRTYQLTAEGAGAIALKRQEWTVFQRGMRAVLGGTA